MSISKLPSGECHVQLFDKEIFQSVEYMHTLATFIGELIHEIPSQRRNLIGSQPGTLRIIITSFLSGNDVATSFWLTNGESQINFTYICMIKKSLKPYSIIIIRRETTVYIRWIFQRLYMSLTLKIDTGVLTPKLPGLKLQIASHILWENMSMSIPFVVKWRDMESVVSSDPGNGLLPDSTSHYPVMLTLCHLDCQQHI